MNLPSEQDAPNAFEASGASAAGSTPKAQVASKYPPSSINNVVATTMAATRNGMSASLKSRSSSNQLYDIRTQHSVSHDSLPESNMSPKSNTSPALMPRRGWSERTFPERSPSPHARAGPPGAMAEAMSVGRSPGGPGIIRRISRGAHNKLRRRASTNHSLRMREQSAGPVLMRRRSDSNGASEFPDVSDLELDSTTDEVLDEAPYPNYISRNNALGISVGRPSIVSHNSTSTFEGGIAPAISKILQNGTMVTKHTKRKRKTIKLWLDIGTARVCWHTSNPSKSFSVDDVREVRLGADSRNARDDVSIADDQEGLWVTIVYDVPERSKGRNIKTMHITMPDDYVFKIWTEALSKVTRQRWEMMNALASSPEKNEKSMAMAWREVMSNKDPTAKERFTLDDARWLCRKLEINCTDSAVKTHFKAVTKDDSLDFEGYKQFVQTFRERKDIQNIYRNQSFGTDLDMSLDSFLEFLRNVQKVDVDRERAHWEGVFNKYSVPAQNRPTLPDAEKVVGQRVLNMQSFQNFMTSSHCAPTSSSKAEVTLDRPLSEYFISSSHNTYLLGRQFAGASSVEGYIATLVKGCRCVEIDCWDGDNGRPMVTHGRSMTSRIPFEDCVSVVAKYAFNSSPYPLIVSLEVHCNNEQQQEMVRLMKKYFGAAMVTEPIIPNSNSLPSPEELRERILIKVKASEEVDQSQVVDGATGRSRARSITSTFARTPSIETSSAMSSPLVSSSATSPSEMSTTFTPKGSAVSVPLLTPNSSTDDSDEIPPSADRLRKRPKTSRIIHELGKLGVYTQGIKFNGFQAPNAKTYNHILSFSEGVFDRLSKNHETKVELEQHNMRHLMREYPSGKRLDSSNFNPLQSWRRGVQMAALNWQTYDVNQQINEAMFAAGFDRLGYVLKPEELRHAKHLPIVEAIDQGSEKKDKKGKKIVKFEVEVISAQRLPRPRNQPAEAGMNPYIEFEMYSAEDKARGIATAQGGTDASAKDGSSGIGSPLRKRTRTVEGNGFDPTYYEGIKMAVETKYPSLIFVRWTVWNAPEGKKSSGNGALLATYTAKLSSLQQGYRHLPLFNPQGEQYRDAKLFVKIKKEAPVPLQQIDDTAYYNPTDPSASPRPESIRTGRSWPYRVFSRNSSQRRKETHTDTAGLISRTSSMDRESLQ